MSWKGSQLKLFLFYYSIIILKDILPFEYFEHHKLFVQAMFILNQSSIKEEELELADRILTEFASRYEDLYTKRHETCNLHLLRHLPGEFYKISQVCRKTLNF